MPIHMWTKEGAILVTKAARYVVPAIIATTGAVIGFLAGTRRKKERAMKEVVDEQGGRTKSD